MKKDLLNTRSAELRKMPYDVPEGYFETFKKDMSERVACRHEGETGFMHKLTPYISMAATFLVIVTAGTLLMKSGTTDEGMTYEDYIVHSDMYVSTLYEDEQLAEAVTDIADEDIIEYLIYTGITAENLEISK